MMQKNGVRFPRTAEEFRSLAYGAYCRELQVPLKSVTVSPRRESGVRIASLVPGTKQTSASRERKLNKGTNSPAKMAQVEWR